MPATITLTEDDSTFFAKCPNCTRSGIGRKILPIYYGRAFTARRWKRNPVCENCETPLVLLFEVPTD